jgi:general secretion pathway protein D
LTQLITSMMTSTSFKSLGLGCLLAGLLSSPASAQFQGFGGFGGFGGGGGTTGRTSTQGGVGQPLGGADISFDPETRRLIVVTDDKTAAQIKEVVTGLDRPSPQVLIKVVFLEATYSKNSDIGFSGGYTHDTKLQGVSGVAGQAFGGPAITALTGANSVLSQAAPGSGVYSILGSDFQATLSAIARAGKTEILSRPSILARNNQSATISLGQQVPLIGNTRFDNFGNQINTINYQSVGVNLSVTPFISSDGNVEMTVTPEISSLADRAQWVAISSGGTNGAAAVLAPVINSRAATTTVVVPDGQTVVIGGLMENTQADAENKVPGLGDIPLLGNLFKRKTKENVKRELMIFLTPTIVTAPKQLVDMSIEERQNQRHAPKAFPLQEMDRFLEPPSFKNPPAPAPAPAPKAPAPK